MSDWRTDAAVAVDSYELLTKEQLHNVIMNQHASMRADSEELRAALATAQEEVLSADNLTREARRAALILFCPVKGSNRTYWLEKYPWLKERE